MFENYCLSIGSDVSSLFSKAISKPLPIVKVLIKPLLFLYFSFVFSKERLQSSYIYNYINMIIQREALST